MEAPIGPSTRLPTTQFYRLFRMMRSLDAPVDQNASRPCEATDEQTNLHYRSPHP